MERINLTATQKETIKRLITYAIILVIGITFAVYLSSVEEDGLQKQKWLENDVAELGRKLDGLNKKTLEFSEAVTTWEALSEYDKNLQGLRINDAKEMLDLMQAKYKFSSLKTTFSKPEEIIGDYKTDTVAMISSIISMSFNAISDESVYNFINDLNVNFPGYIQIKSFSINKPAPVTKEILQKIAAGEDVNIIPITLDFYWHDLKYKDKTVAVPPPAPAGGTP